MNLNLICSKFTYGYFQKANNKGADQSVRMPRLVCTCVVRKLSKTCSLVSRPMCKQRGFFRPFYENTAVILFFTRLIINPCPVEPYISCFENCVDPDQLASKKPADQDPHFFFCACNYLLISRIL